MCKDTLYPCTTFQEGFLGYFIFKDCPLDCHFLRNSYVFHVVEIEHLARIIWTVYRSSSSEFPEKNRLAIPYMSKLSHVKDLRNNFLVFTFPYHCLVFPLFYLVYDLSFSFLSFFVFNGSPQLMREALMYNEWGNKVVKQLMQFAWMIFKPRTLSHNRANGTSAVNIFKE